MGVAPPPAEADGPKAEPESYHVAQVVRGVGEQAQAVRDDAADDLQ